MIDTNLSGADLSDAQLRQAGLLRADLHEANLSGAHLELADLSGANLSGADLRYADLSEAVLSGTDLRSANLGGAEGIAKEKLVKQAKSYGGATMPDGTVKAGHYVTTEFWSIRSFRVGDGWRGYPETTDELLLQGPEGGQLIFARPLHVFDPSNPSEPKEIPAPENADEWASWFQSHPNLDTSEPVTVSVGDASGVRMDVMATSIPENYPRDYCGEQPCVPLISLGREDGETSKIVSYEEVKDRFVFVDDVQGAPVVINFAAPADKFDEVLSSLCPEGIVRPTLRSGGARRYARYRPSPPSLTRA